jgi:tol-pal system protein YbgF
MTSKLYAAATVAMLFAAAAAAPTMVSAASTKERLDSIERQLNSRGLVDMLNRIEQLQRDVQQLRGDIEVQTHTLDDMQRRQREQYIDIDRRLQQLETGQIGILPPETAPVIPVPVTTTAPPTAPVAPPVQPPPVVVAPPVAPVTPAAPQANEQADYDNALAILREGRYAEAVQAFNSFLGTYPQSSYADNASYWLGETHYVTREFDKALATFRQLVSDYPQSPKVPDSRLKMGYIHYEKKDWAAARADLDAVITMYPGTTAARLAADRMQRIKKEGH